MIPAHPARHLLRAKDLVNARYREPLDVPALARSARLSPADFSREFGRAFGERRTAEGAAGGLFFATDDVRASYEQLKSRGVAFQQEPTVHAGNDRDQAVWCGYPHHTTPGRRTVTARPA